VSVMSACGENTSTSFKVVTHILYKNRGVFLLFIIINDNEHEGMPFKFDDLHIGMSSPRTHIRSLDTLSSRPYVIINVAMSADGKLSTRERRQVKISGNDDFSRVDELKAGCDAIMVGIGTVLADDPSLTIKSDALIRMRREGNRSSHPVRIVVDSLARIPSDAKILYKGEGKRIIALSRAADFSCVEQLKQTAMQCGEDIEVELIVCGDDQVDLLELFQELKKRDIHRVMVEGGGTLIMGLLKAGIVDEIHTYIGNMIIGGKDAPTLADGEGFVLEDEFVQLTLYSLSRMENGVLLSWYVDV